MRTPEIFREIAAGSLSGIVVGIVVGGLGSRLVMRLSAIAAGSVVQGVTTANGNRVGEITVGGTIALIIFGGVFAGIFGGLLYASVRPWLAPFARWRGLIFGLGLLGLAGSLILDAANSDFIVLRPPLLNVTMFAVLFLIFGIALVPVFDRTLRALAESSPISGALALLGVVLAALFVGLGLVSGFTAVASGPTTFDLISLLMLGLIVAGLAARALGHRLASPPWRLASYGLLAAALLVGAAYTYGSVVRILS
ncbi:MAG TPA: hypothetical protein VIN63_06185 [Candidatus Limnocylindria bacterium]